MSCLNHIAFIMDGNGRWAKAQGKPRTYGHDIGLEKINLVSEYCNKNGIPYVTFFAFSTENWNRPKKEVKHLWAFPQKHFKKFTKKYKESNIKVNLIGDRTGIPKDALKAFDEAIEKTKDCTGTTITFAMNYGSRDELVRAVNKIKKDVITEKDIQDNLDTHNLPDVDFLIRTSGEQRISNFLLWQIAYSEISFVDYNWPEMDDEKLDEIVKDFKARNRTFGGLKDED